MNKEVNICIKGIHTGDGETSDVGIRAEGTHYYRNGKHYFVYDEVHESGEKSNSILKINSDEVELIKKGYGAVHLYFARGKTHTTFYHTVMGRILIKVDVEDIIVEENEDNIYVRIQYTLMMEEDKVADCTVQIDINSK